jgi:hypothetical protein
LLSLLSLLLDLFFNQGKIQNMIKEIKNINIKIGYAIKNE